MNWQKRSKIKLAELSQETDKIIEAYKPATIEYKEGHIKRNGVYYRGIIGFEVEFEGKIIKYKIKEDHKCVRVE